MLPIPTQAAAPSEDGAKELARGKAAAGSEVGSEDSILRVHTLTMCSLCMERERSIIFAECGHGCCCEVCAMQVDCCPLCRAVVVKRLRIARYLGDSRVEVELAGSGVQAFNEAQLDEAQLA